MPEQPKLDIRPGKADLIVEILSWAILGFLWWTVLSKYSQLPDIIPTHYNLAGEVDDTGSKSSLFLLPSITTVLYIGLTILNRYPHIFNYPGKITPENAYRQYSNAVFMVRIVKLTIGLTFSIISLVLTKDSLSSFSASNSILFILFLVVFPLVPLVVYIIRYAHINRY